MRHLVLGFVTLLLCSSAVSAECNSERMTLGWMHYFAAEQTLRAWRSSEPGSECVWSDLPEARALSTDEAIALWQKLADSQQQSRRALGNLRSRPVEVQASAVANFDRLPPRLHSQTERAPTCLTTPRTWHEVQWTEDLPPFVLRLSAAHCPESADMAAAGSASLLAPGVAVTAAHVVLDRNGVLHCRFRLIPAARPFGAEAQPFGRLFGSVFAHGSATFARWQTKDEFHAQIQKDWALLRMEEPIPDALNVHPVWPVLEFGSEPEQVSTRVVKVGFPRGPRFRSLRPAGGHVSWVAYSICPQIPNREFGFESETGDSGAPIFELPQDHTKGWLKMHSWVSTSQQVNLHEPTTLGPRLDLSLYREWVDALARTAGSNESPKQTR